jgi:hypothetical protein
MVADFFPSRKSLLETRPIYHKFDETIHEHVFCSFWSCCSARIWKSAWRG